MRVLGRGELGTRLTDRCRQLLTNTMAVLTSFTNSLITVAGSPTLGVEAHDYIQ